ncbi:MAG: MATE family efflux transporter [Treponema sp.]|nr:MATE family efflux transporter [Treponema sp.]MBP3607547.1 MATE family efflux transporter [Treponema sp.]
MNKNIEIFENYSVPKAVFTMAIPTITSMIVSVFYNMVDTFFVGQTGDPNQVAAVSVATPVFLFLMAAGNIFGVGGASFVSRALGEKNYDKVKNISSFCFYTGILVGLLGTFLLLTFMTPILKAVGTSENTFKFAKDYLFWTALGGPFIVLQCAFSNLVRSEGASQKAMIGMMIGTITNIVLDPIFILDSFLGIPCLNLGVSGAAIATVIGNIVSVIIFLSHTISNNSVLTLSFNYYKIRNGILKGVLLIGLPASLTNILMSCSDIITNNLLVTYGDIHVAAMGIAKKANMLVIFVQFGIGMGIAPLIGYNYGAKKINRMKSIMKFSMLCTLVTGFILTAIYFIFTKQILSIFINSQEVIQTGIIVLRALMISGPLLGIMFVFNFTFQSMGKAIQSLMLAVSRQGFVFLPLILLLKSLYGLEGVVIAQPIADLVAIIIALGMFLSINKELKNDKI